MKTIPRRAIAILAIFTLIGCNKPPQLAPSGLPIVSMQIGSKTYQLEIATDTPSREKGLMDRDAMAPDHGMIFVFAKPDLQTFWMHHTHFPLDIIFADEHDKIVSIHTMKAFDESTTFSDGPAKYAIELAIGEAASAGVNPGDELHFPAVVDESPVK